MSLSQNLTHGPWHSLQTSYPRNSIIFLPQLFRFMDKQYLDDLASIGKLRLSCFETFKHHKDEQRGDSTEGLTLSIKNDLSKNKEIGVMTMTGVNAYVLSFSTQNGQTVKDAFGESYGEVMDPWTFSNEVALYIPGCRNIIIGPCRYVESKTLLSSGEIPSLDDLKSDENPENISLEKLNAATANMTGIESYFLKEKKYEPQMEYRFIWETDHAVHAPLDIVNPALINLFKI